MSVEDMVARAAARKIAGIFEGTASLVTLTKVEFQNALARAYLDGLEKGQDLEQVRLVTLVRDCPFWPSRSNKDKLMSYLMTTDREKEQAKS